MTPVDRMVDFSYPVTPLHLSRPVDTHHQQPFTPISPPTSNFHPDAFLSHYLQPQFYAPVYPTYFATTFAATSL